ncbi:MAG: cupin-like domain-containing protein [Candidatus Eremiobacteraeota bacterium]|nr:cupin-like domain-containing protein [Candidatus Eremiobacteraeota bacterium]
MAAIPRCDKPSLDHFREEYALPGCPVILTGLTDGWAARRWTPEEMARRFGEVTVELTPDKGTVEGTKEARLSDYVEAVESGQTGGDYLTSWCFRNDCPELLSDFDVPVYFRDDWLEELPELNDMLWLFLGAEGSGMALHQDLGHTAAWNAQVTGLKRWALVSPEDSEYVYEGKVCAFKPNRVRYPRFRKARVWTGDVAAGEVLYIPPAWWHQTQNLKTGFAITANFVDHTNYAVVLSCLEEAGEDDLHRQLSEIAERKLK